MDIKLEIARNRPQIFFAVSLVGKRIEHRVVFHLEETHHLVTHQFRDHVRVCSPPDGALRPRKNQPLVWVGAIRRFLDDLPATPSFLQHHRDKLAAILPEKDYARSSVSFRRTVKARHWAAKRQPDIGVWLCRLGVCQPCCEITPCPEPPRNSRPLALAVFVELLAKILRGKFLKLARGCLLPPLRPHHLQRLGMSFKSLKVVVEELSKRRPRRLHWPERRGEVGMARPQPHGLFRVSYFQEPVGFFFQLVLRHVAVCSLDCLLLSQILSFCTQQRQAVAMLLPRLNRQPPEKQAFRGVCPHDFVVVSVEHRGDLSAAKPPFCFIPQRGHRRWIGLHQFS